MTILTEPHWPSKMETGAGVVGGRKIFYYASSTMVRKYHIFLVIFSSAGG
jgi:hypothetical protein